PFSRQFSLATVCETIPLFQGTRVETRKKGFLGKNKKNYTGMNIYFIYVSCPCLNESLGIFYNIFN
ncbi:MAG: hypothetical protein WB612_06070, partial [Nitrososphaeraceae archaeon]